MDNTPLRVPGKNALSEYVVSFDAVGLRDLDRVGGKNASIGEMIGALTQLGVRVPRGFATTADAFREFLRQGGLEGRINAELDALDSADVTALAACGARIRRWILDTPLPPPLQQALLGSWKAMDAGRNIAVAVRSSATAEDLPSASFAGQQETFLNILGLDNLLLAIRHVFALASPHPGNRARRDSGGGATRSPRTRRARIRKA